MGVMGVRRADLTELATWPSHLNSHLALPQVPVHTGAIQLGYLDETYCCFYLSMLRTWLAVLTTAAEHLHISLAAFIRERGCA